MNIVIVAHFDPDGDIASDLVGFLNKLVSEGFLVNLISTGLNVEKTEKLSDKINVTIRDNVGYDFYSYAEGFKQNIDNLNNAENVILMNSSFKIFDQNKLFGFFESAINEKNHSMDLLSLTESQENGFHCQSYLMRFNKNILASRKFVDWWIKMKPISNRQKVINKYEIGLTRFVLTKGYIAGGALTVNLAVKVEAIEIFKKIYGSTRNYVQLNPCHFMWTAIMNEFGIVKYELLNKNPHGIDISGVT